MNVGVCWPVGGPVAKLVQPLWEAGAVDWLELTVEHAFAPVLPPAFVAGLDRAARAGRLVGHGVLASPYTPRDAVHRDWLRRAQAVVARWPVRWLTDHVGCSRGAGWQGAPMPLPGSAALVSRVQDHLRWVSDALGVPTGLENLALAVSKHDALSQPDLVDAMLRPSDGVLLLDVHNLWCTAVNQGIDPLDYLHRWPLDLVRQVHVAGGRADADGFRRDTHDGPMWPEVLELAGEAVRRCPRVEVVVWERLDAPEGMHGQLAAEVASVRALPAEDESAPDFVRGALPCIAHDPEAFPDLLTAAVRAGDRGAVERAAPGWLEDERAWRVMVELGERWGKRVG